MGLGTNQTQQKRGYMNWKTGQQKILRLRFPQRNKKKKSTEELNRHMQHDEKHVHKCSWSLERSEIMEQKRYSENFPKQTKDINTVKKHYKFQPR